MSDDEEACIVRKVYDVTILIDAHIPITDIWLIVGSNASRRPSMATGRHASNREAPKARYVSILSLFSLHAGQSQFDGVSKTSTESDAYSGNWRSILTVAHP